MVECESAEVVGDVGLNVVSGEPAQAAVLLRALRLYALITRAKCVPPDVLARRYEIYPVHQLAVDVADVLV